MRPILNACRRAPSLEGNAPLTVLAIVLNVEFLLLVFCMLNAPMWMGRAGLLSQLVLLGALAVAWFAWTAAHLTGLVGAGTGGGLRIASLGLLARLMGHFHLVALGYDGGGRSGYDARPYVAPLVWFARNVGLAAYAYGITLVALSCWSERRLRRAAPAWTMPPA